MISCKANEWTRLMIRLKKFELRMLKLSYLIQRFHSFLWTLSLRGINIRFSLNFWLVFNIIHISNRLLRHDHQVLIALEKLTSGEWDGVAFGTDIIANYFNLVSKSQRQIESIRVRTLAPVFLFRKNSIVSQLFNHKVDICLESGLTFHWLAQFNRERRKSPRLPKKLGLVNVIAILQIFTVLCLFSLFVFVLEILCHECYVIEIFLNYLTY